MSFGLSGAPIKVNASVVQVTSRLPPWLKLQVVRNRLFIEHSSPFDRQYTEEIVLINNSSVDIIHFPLPLPEFRNGLKVIDEDNSLLSFYSESQILDIIKGYEKELKENIERRLSESHLLWIRLSDGKPIRPNELRTIRLNFWAGCPTDPRLRWSIFDIPQYKETVANTGTNDTYYQIIAPKDSVIEVVEDREATRLEDSEGEIKIDFLSRQPTKPLKDGGHAVVTNGDAFAYVIMHPRNKSYQGHITYRIKPTKIERRIWQIALPISIVILTGLMLLPELPFKDSILQLLPLKKDIILAFGGVVGTILAALVALINNPLIARTRGLLLIDIALTIAIVLRAGVYGQSP